MSCRYPLVAFDLDGTLAAGLVSVWGLLHRHFGSDPVVRELARRRFFTGVIDYAQWFWHDLTLLAPRGADRSGILEALDPVRPTPGAIRLLQKLRAQGRCIAVISGSIDLLLERLFPEFVFDHVLINRLHFDAQGRLVGGEHTRFDMEGKASGLARLAALEGLELSECAFLGDNENDIEALEAAGLGVAFDPKSPRVAEAADVVVQGPDISQVLEYL